LTVQVFLGLDLGGSGAKALAVTAAGDVVARAKVAYAPRNPRPGTYEFEALEQWASLRDAIRDCVARLPDRAEVVAIGASAAGEAVIPVDRDGRPLAPSIASTDPRGQVQAAQLVDRIGAQRLYGLTGQPPDGIYAVCRAMWLRDERPEVFARVDRFFLWHEFVLSRLGVPALLDSSNASRTMAFDLASGGWSEEILAAADLEARLFAPVASPGSSAGRIPADVAEDLGLESRPLVVTAGFDQACAAIGAGALEDGDGSVGSGSVEALGVISHQRPATIALQLANFSSGTAIPSDRHLTVGSNFGAGNLVGWVDRVTGGRDTFAMIDGLEPAGPSRRLQVIPHLAGTFAPVRDPTRRAAIIGIDLATSPRDLVWATLEGISYQLRTMVETVETNGLPLRRLRLSGGGSMSDAWGQLRADVLGREVEAVAVADAAPMGAAMTAAVGSGAIPDWHTAVASMVRVRRRFEPVPERTQAFQHGYARYRRVDALMEEVDRDNER
jgi:xylulokinase